MPSTDRDLLVETHTLTKEIHRAVFGNGRPGLVQTVAAHDEAIRKIEDEQARRAPYIDVLTTVKEQVTDIQRRTPTHREKVTVWASLVGAVVMALGAVAKALLFS